MPLSHQHTIKLGGLFVGMHCHKIPLATSHKKLSFYSMATKIETIIWAGNLNTTSHVMNKMRLYQGAVLTAFLSYWGTSLKKWYTRQSNYVTPPAPVKGGGGGTLVTNTKGNGPSHDKTNKMACAPSEDSDQHGHPPSLIRVFAVRTKKDWVLSYPLSAKRRLIKTCLLY